MSEDDDLIPYCRAKLKQRADDLAALEQQARTSGTDPALRRALGIARRRYALAQKTLLVALSPPRADA